MTLQEMDQTYVANTYRRFPVELGEGKGSVVTDLSGKQYIDMGTGIGVNTFGIADEEWQQAVIGQIGRLQHMSNLYYTEPCARLAQMLCQRTGMKKVFFSNSGAEANECAIKVARKYGEDHKGPGYSVIVTLENSFHGRTLATLAATGQDQFHRFFQPLPQGFVHAPVNDLETLKKVVGENKTAAVLIECIQGEGGVNALDLDFVQGLSEFTRENDLLLLVDEVQAGNGRTGKLYSYMNYGIQPDVVSTAKGLAGGLPLGATMLGEKAQNVLGFGDHGSTFGGNPVCCAAALSILGRLDEPFLQGVRERSDYIFRAFENCPGVRQVCGMGLMIGLQTVRPAGDVVEECMENGVLCLTAKDRVRLLPALNIPMDLLEQAVRVIRDACEK